MMDLPKILAIYLPQFHQTKDNDLWWGEGFTDWETVKTAESCFDGHVQPRVPYSGMYYDLSNVEVIKHQAKLAKEYGIDGFCLYHYYFEKGRRELDIPEKLILKNKDINISYCLNWASESWIRSWSRIQGNVWAERYDQSGKGDNDGVLIRQNYGSESLWKEHFFELLPHFKDERYIRKDGKPVFIFYSPDDIPCLESMVCCWRKLAIENGLDGLYLIGARMKAENRNLDAALVYEPRNSINRLNNKDKADVRNGVRCYDYRDFCAEVLLSKPIGNMKTYYSCTVDYDDSPRRGNKGECFVNVTHDTFRDEVSKIIAKSVANENEMLFINAWNEWGEGMHLEPDEFRGFEMLNAIKEARYAVNTSLIEQYKDKKVMRDSGDVETVTYEARKFKELFEILDHWLFAYQDSKTFIKEYLSKAGYSSFAIYGMSSLGKHLALQAKKEGVIPAYGIDRYVGMFGDEIKIFRPEEKLPNVDCIIVTAFDFLEIKESLKKKTDAEIVYIGDLINKIYQ